MPKIFYQRLRPLRTDSLEEFDRGGGAERFRHSGRKLGQHADRVLQQRLDLLKEGCTLSLHLQRGDRSST